MMGYLKPSATHSLRAQKGPRVYLAGKISMTDWRGEILGPDDPGAIPDHTDLAPLFDATYAVAHLGFRYGGPFFVSCDHGCAHGPGTHGNGIGGCLEGGSPLTPDRTRSAVFRVSLERIACADFVFAYLNETDAFGTLFEIGHANAIRKPVFLLFGPELSEKQRSDFWFPAQASVVLNGSIPDAFWRAVQIWKRCRQPSVW